MCGLPDSPPTNQNETAFNRLPLPSRVAATRQFVRDLTFLSRRADALVVTGSSNVGRLLMMLFDAENTNRSKAEGELQSRRREMRSLDTRFGFLLSLSLSLFLAFFCQVVSTDDLSAT